MKIEERLERMEDKVDDLVELNHAHDLSLQRIATTLEKNTESLIIHERRTTLSEDRLEKFELKFEKHLSFLQGALWIIGGFATLTVIVFKVIDHLQK